MSLAVRPARRNHAAWLGPVLAVAGMVSYFEYFARFPILRDFPWVNLPLVLAGMALSAYGVVRAVSASARWWIRSLAAAGLLVSLLAGGFFIVYVFRLSSSLPEAASAATLERAPDFELPDAGGAVHRLRDYRGSNVVLVFYRGHW